MKSIRALLSHDAAPGMVLVLAAIAAVLFENSALRSLYQWFLAIPVTFQFGDFVVQKPHLLFINDGLMAIFFLFVGLEIKRELVTGELSSLRSAALPIVAAIGGMVLPAAIFVLLNHGDAYALRGWAIPAATDIAFSLGVLALCGKSVPSSLKVFLTALAIIDDMGAIVIIALFYSEKIVVGSLLIALVTFVLLAVLNRLNVRNLVPYVILGLVLWASVLKSGAHSTIAGVLLATMIPLGKDESGSSPLEDLEHALKPWVLWAILPLFAFANSGVPLEGLTIGSLFEPIPLGIMLGLFVGKQLGVFGFASAFILSGLGQKPAGASWLQLYGVSALAGIGFTMSLFIASLAYKGEEFVTMTRIGVLSGSILSGILGFVILKLGTRERKA